MEHHIVVVWRHGGKGLARVYLLGPAPKRRAVLTAEDTFRKENGLARNIFLMSRCVFSGSQEDGLVEMDKIESEMKEKANGNTHSGSEEGPATGTEESASAVCGSEESS